MDTVHTRGEKVRAYYSSAHRDTTPISQSYHCWSNRFPSNSHEELCRDKKAAFEHITEIYGLEIPRKKWNLPVVLLLLIARSRLLIRFLSALVAITSFGLILTPLVLFAKAKREGSINDNLDLNPAKAFTGIGAASAVVSFALTVASCLSKKIKQVCNLSNAIFFFVGVAGFGAWMGGCLYLQKISYTQTLWSWACQNVREGAADDFDYRAVCNLSLYAWDLGILQATFELLTVLNVLIAFIVLKIRKGQW